MMIKPLLAVVMTLSLSLTAGCSSNKTCGIDCDKPCCVEGENKQCPADCDKPCCAGMGEANTDQAKTCPADCTKPCCADKAKAQ